jgi:hypothetical protein
MKIINVRTPYSIVIDEPNQVETQIKIYIWNRPNITPVTPTYQFSSIVPSLANRKAIYNIANEVKEYINPIIPVYVNSSAIENFNMWCYVTVERYFKTDPLENFELIDSETYIAVNGYNSVQQGLNLTYNVNARMLIPEGKTSNQIMWLPITANDQTNYKYPYVNIIIEVQGDSLIPDYYVEYFNVDGSLTNNFPITSGINMYKVPLYRPDIITDKPYSMKIYGQNNEGDYELVFERIIEMLCEVKYSPLLLSFINKEGGWENLWCMKASEDSIDVKETEFKSNQGFQNFNANVGQRKSFNKNGKRSIKLNTGYLEEDNKIIIEQLYLSETIILDGKPVMLKGNSTTLKKSIKELINYTLDFDFNYNLINDIV